MSDDELVTFNIYSIDELREAKKSGKEFRYILFWTFQKEDIYLNPCNETCLSQWFPSNFEDEDGNKYCCCEQYMMAKKAELFGDKEILQKILESKNPEEIFKLGREVKNFDQKIWNRQCQEIVFKGNQFKFKQNKKLYDYITSIPLDTIFVEASPRDGIWGINLSATSKKAKDPLKWKGKNYLGFQLTRVRDYLISEIAEGQY